MKERVQAKYGWWREWLRIGQGDTVHPQLPSLVQRHHKAFGKSRMQVGSTAAEEAFETFWVGFSE